MKFQDVPLEKQMYTLVLMNKSEYQISGITKEAIMNSPSQFVQLERGDVINKSYIAEITANREQTKSKLLALDGETLKILENNHES